MSFEHQMDAALQLGLARLSEITQTGFDTDVPFDAQLFQASSQKLFILTVVSPSTRTSYGIALAYGCEPDGRVRGVQVELNGCRLAEGNFRMVTLVNNNGAVRVVPGWPGR